MMILNTSIMEETQKGVSFCAINHCTKTLLMDLPIVSVFHFYYFTIVALYSGNLE